ncbi:MAG: hypothetical protein EOP56_14475 [Sphingobacteriales bacterium]|nr:MAG: hypothetical protein EOP56_14475 [Sphingobacteriales bacterium]
MTFEDFKKHFEQFAKLDTPEKLAFCKRKYKTYLQQQEDADFFEPLEGRKNADSVYENNLYDYLGFDKITKDQILFLAQPSFSPEYILVIEKSENRYLLTHRMMEESYWRIYFDKTDKIAEVITSMGYLSKTLGEQIFFIIETSIITARKHDPGYIVLDGTQFMLSKVVDGARQDVFKHGLLEGSKTDRVTQMLLAVIKLTTEDNLPEVEKEIERLITLAE